MSLLRLLFLTKCWAPCRRFQKLRNLKSMRSSSIRSSTLWPRTYMTRSHVYSRQSAQANWSVAVRDRFMVARTFHFDNLSLDEVTSRGNETAAGSTIIADALLSGSKLHPEANYLLDICAAQEILRDVLAEYNYRNLDIVFPSPNHPGRKNLEGLAKTIWEKVVSRTGDFDYLNSLRIELQDPGAKVTFESPISTLYPAVTSVSVWDRFQLSGPLELKCGIEVEATLSGRKDSDDTVLDYRLLKDVLSDVRGNVFPAILNNTAPLARSIWTEVGGMLSRRGLVEDYDLKIMVVEADGSTTCYCQPLSSMSQPVKHGGWRVEMTEGCRVTHSFQGECFGTAQGSHGTTFEVSTAFELCGDIARFDRVNAARVVSKVLASYDQQDLDKLEEFRGSNTTCEHMAQIFWEKIRCTLPQDQQDVVSNFRVRVRESDVAFVDYEDSFAKESRNIPHEVKKTNLDSMCNVLSFVGPSKVEVKLREETPRHKLLSNEVEIDSLFSLVSPGTELKAFKGTFKEGEPMDTNFYDGKVWKYPMEYGYSLVGKVASAGSDVPEEFIGKTVFAFLPHVSNAIEDWRNLLVIPPDISPEDGTFLPAVETALSIVHDAHPAAMESMCVFGQGLVGRLVAWVLSKTNPLGRLVVVDPCEARRVESIRMGAHEALPTAPAEEKFDVCVEVSGNSNALQGCLHSCKYAGKVIVASWYSDAQPVPLQLGTAFHRSHINIVSSQVSQIPGSVADRWSKERRFDACWELIRQLEPSKRIPTDMVPLEKAQEAFERLANRESSCIQFSYKCADDKSGTTETDGARKVKLDRKLEGGAQPVEFVSKAMLPTTFGTFDTRVFNINGINELCVVLLVGEIGRATKDIHMRLHDSCFTSEVLGSCKCDCKHQLEKAQKLIQKLVNSDTQSKIFIDQNNAVKEKNLKNDGNSTVGMIIYTFQEGRGIGLGAKMAAYDLQERLGYDTVTANEKLGLPVENRKYNFVPSVLESLGLDLDRVSPTGKTDKLNIHLLTSNPYKVNALKDLGILTSLNPHIADIDQQSMAAAYVNVKAEKMGHVVTKDAFLKPQVVKHDKIIEEVTNKLRSELWRFKQKFGNQIESNLPFVTLSYAQSLDGTIGNAHPLHTSQEFSMKNGVHPNFEHNGHNNLEAPPRLILSGDLSMKMTHVLRADHDAILVGVGTVLSDDPRLTVRCGVSAVRNPTPVILDSSLRTPLDCKLVTQARDRVLQGLCDSDFNLLILTSKASMDPSESVFSPEKSKAFQELSNVPGVKVVAIESVTSKNYVGVPLLEAFQYLRQRCDFQTVMVEGGATLIASLLQEPIVSHIVLTIAPSFVPGGVKVVSFPNENLTDRFELISRDTFKLGDDWVVTGNIKRSK